MNDASEIQRALGRLVEQPDPRARTRMIQTIARESIPGKLRLLGNQVIAVGLGIDRWSLDQAPVGVVMLNKGDQPMVWQLSLACQAGPDDLPLTALVDDGEQRVEVTFEAPGTRRVTLPPVEARSEALYIITTDKSWTPGTHDQRRLGVNVDVTPTATLEELLHQRDPERRAKLTDEIARESFPGKGRLLGNQIVAAGLSLDHWTLDGQPAGVVFTNYDEREVAPELVFGCHAGPDDLPVTLLVEDGRRTREYTFDQPGFLPVALSPVAPHSKRMYIITTDKSWTPGPGDPRQLGVSVNISPSWTLRSLRRKPDAYIRVKLAEVIANEPFPGKTALLGEVMAAVGLSGDHWTVGDEPGAVVVTNTFDEPLLPELCLACNAPAEVLPLTATVDDGQQRREVVFAEPGVQAVDLSPVPHHSRRLYILSTDKTWSPGGGDERELGVNVQVAPGAVLAGLLQTPELSIWDGLARAVAAGGVPETREVLPGEVWSVGLSPDDWTDQTRPAAVVVSGGEGEGSRVWELELACHASAEELPLDATVFDGEGQRRVRFEQPGSQTVVLAPAAGGTERLFVVQAHGSWSPGGGDPRQLGVRVAAVRRSVRGTLAALLKTPDEAARAWALAQILEADEEARLELAEGVATAVGLTGDCWTTEAAPAGLALHNPGDEELVPDIHLDCHAGPQSLPIVAVVENGRERREVRFKEAGSRTVSLSPLAPGEQRLYVITTDRTWSPGTEQDQRQLGVRITLEL